MALAVIMGMTVCMAQQIAVVSENGKTSICESLEQAIETATNGSVIYLSGGGFQISDAIVITKKLCIIGVGYKAKSGNVDGSTNIGGNLRFGENSHGSSVIGCYITGNVYVGANDVVVKCCNVNSVQANSDDYTGMVVCQNYIRNDDSWLNKGSLFANNIAYFVNSTCGKIINNVFFGARPHFYSCFVKGNIFLGSLPYDGGGNTYYANMAKEDIGDDFVNIGEKEWADLFVNYNDGSISSDFHFKDEYKLYKDYGVYGGTGFNTSGQPPLPFFESKSIPEQTDAEGNLTIHIRVNNGEKKAE